MARYIDSGSGQADQYAGHWLAANVVTGIREFRCQFGYFSYSAIESFADVLRDLAESGGQVHFVLGSGGGSLLAADAQRVLRVAAGAHASLSIVAFADVLFHPKTVHIVRADNSVTAVVGSSNLTRRGLGENVEAGVVFDSRAADSADQLDRIRDAIDRWRELRNATDSLAAQAVFPITSDDDIRELAESGIINVPDPGRPRTGSRGGASGGGNQLPRRSGTWQSEQTGWRPEIPDLIEVPPNPDDPEGGESPPGPAPPGGTQPTGSGRSEVLLMRVRPRRNGNQVQISKIVLNGSFMSGATEVVLSDGSRRSIGSNAARGAEANTERFEAPGLRDMTNPVARFSWIDVDDAANETDPYLQLELFDAAIGGEGAEIFRMLEEGITTPPVTNLDQLSRDFTGLSTSDRESAQWYRLDLV